MADLGRIIDPASLVGEPVPSPSGETGNRLRTEVLWVDHFGNAQLNVRPADAVHLGSVVELRVRGETWPARFAETYADIGPGPAVGLVADSYGLLSISCERSSAAALIGLQAGDEVWLGRPPVT